MAFESISEIRNRTNSTRRGDSHSSSDMYMSVSKGAFSKTEKEYTKTLSFSISESLVENARFRVGDRVDVLFDKENGLGKVELSDHGAMTISKAAKSKRARLTLRLRPGMPYPAESKGVCNSIEISAGGFSFNLPDNFKIYSK